MIKATISINGVNSVVEADSGVELANFISLVHNLGKTKESSVISAPAIAKASTEIVKRKYTKRTAQSLARMKYNDHDFGILIGTVIEYLTSPTRGNNLNKIAIKAVRERCHYKGASKTNIGMYANRLRRYLVGQPSGLTAGNIARVEKFLADNNLTVQMFRSTPQVTSNFLGNPQSIAKPFNMFQTKIEKQVVEEA